MNKPPTVLTPGGLDRDSVVEVARRGGKVAVSPEARAVLEASAKIVAAHAGAAEPVYGVSTGFGSLATTVIPADRREELQRALIRSHAAGMGPPVEDEVVRAMMLLRARSLALGYSGVRPVVVDRIVDLLNARITPTVPEHGSLGASGDLAPLAHIATAPTACSACSSSPSPTSTCCCARPTSRQRCRSRP
jgi:histidine ammonia-lyase